MKLPTGTTLDGYEIKTTADDSLRHYFTPVFKNDGNSWGCIAVVSTTYLMQSKINYKLQYVFKLRGFSAKGKAINAEVIVSWDRVGSVDTYLIKVNNLGSKRISSANFKAVLLGGNIRLYLSLDSDNEIVFVENTSIVVGEDGIFEIDRITEPYFVSDTVLAPSATNGDQLLTCEFNNLLTNKITHFKLNTTSNILDGNTVPLTYSINLNGGEDFKTIPSDGTYRIQCSVGLNGVFASTSKIGILTVKSDGSTIGSTIFDQSLLTSGSFLCPKIDISLALTVGKVLTFEVRLINNTGSIQLNNTQSFLTIEKIA